MPRDIYNDTIINTDTNGVPTVLMSGVLVSVYKAGTTTAVTIYTDRAQPTQQPNPFEAVNGVVRFWADQGEYDVNYHDNLLRIADQTIGWNSMPGGAAGITPPMLAPGATPPPGSMFPYVGASEPPGYKLCNGQALAKTTYALLYAALGKWFSLRPGRHYVQPSRHAQSSADGIGAGVRPNVSPTGPVWRRGPGHEHP